MAMIVGTFSCTSRVIAIAVPVALALVSLPAGARPAKPVLAFEVDGAFPRVAFAPNGKLLACDLALRDIASGKLLGTGVPGENLPACTFVAFSPDGERLASVHFNRGLIATPHALCLWNITADNQVRQAATLVNVKEQRDLYEESLHHLIFSPDSRMLATRLPGDTTAVWETASGKERLRLDTQGIAVAFGPNSRTLTSVSRTGLVQHWDLATRQCIDAVRGAPRRDFLFVCNAAASADGKVLALSDHHSIVLKDARTGTIMRRFDDLGAGCFALSADGNLLAVADGGVIILDGATGKEKGRLGERKQSVHALAFSADGRLLAVGLEESVEVWEVAGLVPAGKPKPERDSVSPLDVKVITRKKSYALALGGKSAEEFARQFQVQKPLPASSEVDLILTLRNTSDKKLTLDPNGAVESYLVGDGALNHPEFPYQTGVVRGDGSALEPKRITLLPGESYQVPIKSLDNGHSQQSYWLLPGEYTLHVMYHTSVKPAPDGWYKDKEGTGYGTLRAAPLRLKVVAETK
jgi:hypothetical protein